MSLQKNFITKILFFCLFCNMVCKASKSPTVELVSNQTGPGGDKLEVKFEYSPDEMYNKAATHTHRTVTSVLSNLELSSPISYESVPFLNMAKWQKYSCLGSREYLRVIRIQDKELYEDVKEIVIPSFGEVHDDRLPLSCVADDNIMEEREVIIVRKVKKYFKLSTERFLKVPIKIDSVLNNIEEANQSDHIHFKKQIKSRFIVREDVHKELKVKVLCFLDKSAMEKKNVLDPQNELTEFMKKYKLTDEGSNEKSNTWICCDSKKKKLESQFLLHEYSKTFPTTDGKLIQFKWLQTYLDGTRVDFLDTYRLRFKIFMKSEPTEEERKKLEYKEEAKAARKERESRKRRNKSKRRRGKYSSSSDDD